jgi:hypothetical protein
MAARWWFGVAAWAALAAGTAVAAEPAKVVLIAGANAFKPGEHEYAAGCDVLAALLRQTPNVAPEVFVGWPKSDDVLTGAKAVVFFFDGGDKHAVLQGDRATTVQKLADSGVGIVHFHQTIDYPKALGDRARGWAGAAWEKGTGKRAHWVATFGTFPDHPIFRGVSPFAIDDGWIFGVKFVPGQKGVTPLLKTVNPKSPGAKADKAPGDEAVVAWAYERPGGGRAFTFTGCHLHASLAKEGYRRFLVNGILWSAGVDVPATGAPVALTEAELRQPLEARKPAAE